MRSVPGQLFRVLEDKNNFYAPESKLTSEQQRHLDSACNVYSLLLPGQTLTFQVTVGNEQQMPAIAHDKTLKTAEPGPTALGTLTVRSEALGKVSSTHKNFDGQDIVLRLPHPQATPASTKPPAVPSLARKVYREVEKRSPLTLDFARETIMRRRERVINAPIHRKTETLTAPPATPRKGDKPAILFGLHWLQTGGAEQWAFETINLAKKLGFTPVIITDQPSVHPLISSEVFDDCVLLVLSYESPERVSDLDLARAIHENFTLTGIVLHHSYWLYQALPWFKGIAPQLPVVDCLHIIEYLGGGYAGLAVEFDEFIDIHHVISPQLVDWLSSDQSVDTSKLLLSPLTKLTAARTSKFKTHDVSKPFTISFIGRLSRQKRPDLFLMLVARLKKMGANVRVIMHGDGEMRHIVDELSSRFKLTGDVIRRDESFSVYDTLQESDLLVISSINEGITLTTFEAVAAGVPVLSANVGSQRSIVSGDVLLDRAARPFIKGATAQIEKMRASEKYRESVWQEQRDAVEQLSLHDDAETTFERLFKTWLV